MTKDQVRQELERMLPEYLDGYILIGRIAGQPKIVVAQHIPDIPTKAMLVFTMNKAVEDMTGPALRRN